MNKNKKCNDYNKLEPKHIQFYKGLKKDQLENISSEKIDMIERFATLFSANKYRDLKLRFIYAIEKAYLCYNTGNITCYTPKKKSQGFAEEQKGDVTTLPIENDAEVLLFVMFATDPEFLLLRHSANKKTIEEMKSSCYKYAYFWDLQLLIIEQRFTKLLLSRQGNLLEDDNRIVDSKLQSRN
ncbi:MAG: hypothetical protein IJO33_05465 [Bacilli bacterium]|nr:hypothetical protein [Bacilli bacterium]